MSTSLSIYKTNLKITNNDPTIDYNNSIFLYNNTSSISSGGGGAFL